MVFSFEPNFIEKLLWESFFLFFFFFFFAKWFFFFASILTRSGFWSFVLLIIWSFWVYTHMVKFRTEIPTGNYSKMNESKWTPLCTNGNEKQLRHLSVNVRRHYDTIKWARTHKWRNGHFCVRYRKKCIDLTTLKAYTTPEVGDRIEIVFRLNEEKG